MQSFSSKKNPNAIGIPKGDKAFYVIVFILLATVLVTTLYPIILVFSSSFSSPHAVTTGQVKLLPVGFSLEGYRTLLQEDSIWRGYANTIFYTFFGTIINMLLTVFAAYPLSRQEMFGYRPLNFFFMFTMWFNGGLIPTYLLMKQLHVVNSRWALLVIGAINVYNVVIMRTFFANSIPAEIFESASIDGCGYFRFLFAMVLPLSGAVIAVVTLFYAVAHWNAYFNAFIYLSNSKLFPLQIVLRDILMKNQIDASMSVDLADASANIGLDEVLKYCLIIVACLPVWCVYPFVQKFFVQGVMLGSVKG